MLGGVTKPARVTGLLWWPRAAPRCFLGPVQLWSPAALQTFAVLTPELRSYGIPAGRELAGAGLSRVGVSGLPQLVHTHSRHPRAAGKQEERHKPIQAAGIAKGPALGCVCWGPGEKGGDGAQRLKPWDPPDLLLPRVLGTRPHALRDVLVWASAECDCVTP